MCFSASASFTAASVLSLIGILGIKINSKKNLRLFSVIPLLFGIQQATEGLVWITMNNPESIINKISIYIFLIFAMVIWPTIVPLSLSIYDKEPQKKILKIITAAGSMISLYAIYQLITKATTANIATNSICYSIANIDPFILKYGIYMYLIPTIIPFFITKMPLAKLSGITITISLIISLYFKYESYGSVWCFFAALLSAISVFSIYIANRPNSYNS